MFEFLYVVSWEYLIEKWLNNSQTLENEIGYTVEQAMMPNAGPASTIRSFVLLFEFIQNKLMSNYLHGFAWRACNHYSVTIILNYFTYVLLVVVSMKIILQMFVVWSDRSNFQSHYGLDGCKARSYLTVCNLEKFRLFRLVGQRKSVL